MACRKSWTKSLIEKHLNNLIDRDFLIYFQAVFVILTERLGILYSIALYYSDNVWLEMKNKTKQQLMLDLVQHFQNKKNILESFNFNGRIDPTGNISKK